MRRMAPACALAVALVAGAAQPAPALAAAPASDTPAAPPYREAMQLYRDATKLYEAGNLAAAEPLYQRAWELHHSYDIASNLGALELELGKPRAAAELLSYALDQFPARGREQELAVLEARRAEARKQIAVLRFKVNVAGVEVALDGRVLGRTPIARETFVEPGERKVTAKLDGYRDLELTFQAPRGMTYEVTLPMRPLAVVKRSTAPAIVGSAIFTVAAVAGTALFTMSEGQHTKAIALHDALKNEGKDCSSSSPTCSDLHSATSQADTLSRASIPVFILGGAALIGTVAYLAWPNSKSAGKTDVRASLGLSPTGGGAVLVGSF